MIKVLFITNSLGYGGAAKILTFVANNISRGKFEAAIYNLNISSTYQNLKKDITIFTDKSSNIRIIRRVSQITNILRCIRQYKPNVIVSFITTPNFLAVISGKLARVPVIISERGDPYQCKSIPDKIIYSLLNFANGAVFQTEAAKSYFSERLQKKSCVIGNPVIVKDESVTADLDNPLNEISFVARFDNRQKRQDLMLKAFKIVNAKYPEYVLKFYGAGPDEDYIKNVASDLGLSSNVLFMGLAENPIKEIYRSKVFVLTSDYEGIPNALIEAMSIGLPVVSTDCSPGGARMLIEDGVNGMIVPTGDYHAVADKIIDYIENPDLARKCGNNAKKIADIFSPEKILRKWEDYILRISRGYHE